MNLKPLILGHRGASAVAPENTLAAFSRSIRDGADGIEFDVRLSGDHVPVVIHDGSLKRTGNVDHQVSEMSAADLQRIDVGAWFEGTHDTVNERVPLLEQVFELYQTTEGILYVELKCEALEAAALATEVVQVIRDMEMSKRVVVESFDLKAIAEVKRIDAAVRTAALFEPKLLNPVSVLRPRAMINQARECAADEIAFHHTLARPHLVEEARTEGFEVVVWTVDDPRWIARAVSMDIKALIANNPAAMIEYRNSRQ